MTPTGSARSASGIEWFGVEDRAVQLCWSRLPAPRASIQIGDVTVEVDATPPDWYRLPANRSLRVGAGGPGTVLVAGLDPDTSYDVIVTCDGRRPKPAGTVRTLPSPHGRLLARFATISDCHVGEYKLGGLRRLRDPRPRPPGLAPYPVRCGEAAIAEAEAWGAQLILAKGDLTQEGGHEEAEDAADMLATASVPVEVNLGNHDVRGEADLVEVFTRKGLSVSAGARAVDLPGVRIVIGHSPVSGIHAGRIEGSHRSQLVTLASEVDTPAVVALHHPPGRWPVPIYYPPPISRRDSRDLLGALKAAKPASLIIAGHTHRNRRYQVDGVDVAEVGSTKDYPGQWAGYNVYEGGIRQVVRRTARPDVIAWTQMTKRAMFGLWGLWSPGSIDDRCWTLEWPER